MADPLEDFRMRGEEGFNRSQSRSGRISPSRRDDSRRSANDSVLSNQEMASGILGQIKTLHPILKWIGFALIFLLFLIACRYIASLKTSEMKEKIKDVPSKFVRNCDREMAHFLDYHRMDTRVDTELKLQVPDQRSIGLYAQTWIDSHRHWMLQDYKSKYSSIMSKNFKKVDVPPTVDGLVVSLQAKDSIVSRMNDPQHIRNIIEKLQQYESIIGQEYRVRATGAEFKRELNKLQHEYDDCHAQIKALDKEIQKKITSFENPDTDIERKKSRIVSLSSKIRAIDEEIPLKRSDLESQLRDLDQKIADARRNLQNRVSIESDIRQNKDLLNNLKKRLSPVKADIGRLEDSIGRGQDRIKELNFTISESRMPIEIVAKKIAEFESRMSIKPVDNQELCDLVRGVGTCEKRVLKDARASLEQVKIDVSIYSDKYGGENVYIEDLNKEDKNVQELAKDFDDLVKRAEGFPHRRVEALSEANRKILLSYRTELDGYQKKATSDSLELDKLSGQITIYRDELDIARISSSKLEEQIAQTKDLIRNGEDSLKGDSADPAKLEKERQSLDDVIRDSIAMLNKERAINEQELVILKDEVGPMEDYSSRHWNDVSSSIAHMNKLMNECKGIELLLKKFAEESKKVNGQIDAEKTKVGHMKKQIADLLQEIEAI